MAENKKFTPLSELISLEGQTAIVTGGAMGIGFAIAYRLAEAGAQVVITDLDRQKGGEAAGYITDCGFKSSFLPCDVSREDEVKQTVNSAISSLGRIDILVNNAGIFPFTPFLELTPADIEKVLAVNIKGMLYFSQEAGKRMIEAKRSGCIINLASIDSVHPSHLGLPVYDASKGAVLSLTKSLAKELGQYGIRVNAIAPGGILTEGSIRQSREGTSGRAILRGFLSRIPLGRMGIADEIGRVALFLASDLAAYMTGSLVVVDGGYLLS
jgi:NAD(P)-dependent dehydrogenase (short-subunit alcohol dehydrogenase family)